MAVLALLWIQALGLMHPLAHGTAADPGMHLQQRVAAERAAQVGWLEALFDQHKTASDCRLYDGLVSNGLTVQAALSVAALPLGAPHLRSRPRAFVARWAAAFEARGPPVPR